MISREEKRSKGGSNSRHGGPQSFGRWREKLEERSNVADLRGKQLVYQKESPGKGECNKIQNWTRRLEMNGNMTMANGTRGKVQVDIPGRKWYSQRKTVCRVFSVS